MLQRRRREEEEKKKVEEEKKRVEENRVAQEKKENEKTCLVEIESSKREALKLQAEEAKQKEDEAKQRQEEEVHINDVTPHEFNQIATPPILADDGISQIVNDKVELFAVADAAHDATQSNNDDAAPAPTIIDVVACLQSLINAQLSNGETLRTIAEGQRELANTLNVVLDKVSEL
ncbi:hypothetical protein RGQ29_002139 [Quercus rubra]|nr:hypothetical protein RGQ29_002139 [Quercus rubra]